MGIGLILCVNAAVLGWTGTGNAQDSAPLPGTTCAAYDLWADSNFSPVFIGPLADSTQGLILEESVRVSLTGLANGNLTQGNKVIATEVVADYFDQACDGIDRAAGQAPTIAPEPTPTPEPTAAPAPTSAPEPTATPAPAPEPTPAPTAVFVPSETDSGSSDDTDAGTTGSTGDTTLPALAQTGSGPLTQSLAFAGIVFIMVGAAVMAVEAREPEFVVAFDNRVPKSERYFLD